MGRGDNRLTLKVRRLRAQRKKKQKLKERIEKSRSNKQ